MADDKDLKNQQQYEQSAKETSKATKETAKDSLTIKDSMDQLAKSMLSVALTMADVVRETREAKNASRDFKSEFDEAAKLQNQVKKDSVTIAELSVKIGKGQKLTNKETEKLEKANANILRMEDLKLDLQGKMVNALDDEKVLISGVLKVFEDVTDQTKVVTEGIETINDAMDELEKKTSFFDSMADVAAKIPGFGTAFKEFGKASKAAGEAAAKGENAMAAGAKQLTGAVGKMALIFSVSTFVKGISKTNQDVTDLSRNLNMSRESARGLDERFRTISANTKGLTSSAFREGTMAVADGLGIAADLSEDTLVTMGAMTKKFGLTADQAGRLAQVTAATGQDMKEFNNDLIGRTMLQNQANNVTIRYQDVMKDVASASASVQLSTAKMPGGLANAAFQARRLGLSFSTMEGIAGNLLDIESSIGAEMEAELLTGRQLDLNGARLAANRNDMVGMAQELNKQGITSAAFGDMTRIQQTAIAKAMGMSREEMSEMFIKQEAIKKLGGDPSEGLSEAIKKRYKIVDAMAEGADKQAALAQLAKDAGSDETVRQLRNSSLQEKQAEAMEKMAEAAGSLSRVLEPITWFMDKIAGAAGETLAFITKMGSKFSLIGKLISTNLKPVIEIPKKGLKFLDKIKNFLPTLGKKAGGAAGKSLLKKIPIIGLIVGVGMAISRASKGDWWGALGEIGSGVASLFPGIGTGISVGIDAALLGTDLAGVTGGDQRAKRAQGDTVLNTEDFVIKPLDADTITMAGGTKLGGNVEGLLEKLISVVEKHSGGDVNLDGFKVGEVLKLSATTT